MQEALVAAHTTWPRNGIPDNPRAWLVTAATRRLVDEQRSAVARRRRELDWATTEPEGTQVVQHDDSLTVLLMCCHPVLSPASAVALTLRAVGGLTTAEIATAYLVPEPTMAQRISRAKRTLRESGASFGLPANDELGDRVRRALAVVYLLYNEGYSTWRTRATRSPSSSSGGSANGWPLSRTWRLAREIRVAIVARGDPVLKVPACVACHGQRLTGALPAIPGLLGLPRDYINAQFGAWRNGTRRAHAPDCMATIAGRLSLEDVTAISGWLASEPVPDDASPVPDVPHPMPLACGSQPERP